jgi:4-hydroxy-tetrahydrodipicolinate synthase
MSRETLKAPFKGVIATVPTAFDNQYRVDYGRMADATEHWVQAGLVNGRTALKVGASMGEGQQLREEEWVRLLDTVVQAAKGRVPVLGAIHHKDTLRTIEDARRAADLGVAGLQVSPPIFNQPNQEDMLRYFGAVSDAIEIGVMTYNTHWLEGGAIYPDTFRRMADFERIAAIKWSPPKGVAYEEIFDLVHTFNILDNSGRAVLCHRLGGHGYLIDGIDAYPPYYLNLWDLMEAGRYDEAQSEWDRVVEPLKEFHSRVVANSGGDGKTEKAMSEIMGFSMGPPRPPSIPLDDEEMTELRRLMIDWEWPVAQSAIVAARPTRP